MKNRQRSRIAHRGWLRPLCLLVIISILLSLTGPLGRNEVREAQADPYPPEWNTSAVHYLPAPWPSDSQWVAYTRGGSTINDPRTQDPSNGGTRPQNYVNISSGCTDQGTPSVYYYYNAISQTISYRFRIEQIANTYATGPSAGTYGSADPWNAGTWSVLIDINGDGYRDFALQLDGQTGAPSTPVDRVVSLYSTAKNQYVNYLTDSTIKYLFHNPAGFVYTPTNTIMNFHGTLSPDNSWPNGASETNWDYGTTRAINISNSSCNEYIVDYQIPLAMLNSTSVGGPAVTADTPMAFMFATANSNSNPLQKDVAFLGDYTSDANKPAPFGDIITLNWGRQAPAITAVSAAGCNTTSLAATVNAPITITGGNAATTITSANFYYYADANSNGLADDGNSWTIATTASTTNSPVGYFTGSWDSTELVKGQYLIGITATDSISTTASWLTGAGGNPTRLTQAPFGPPSATVVALLRQISARRSRHHTSLPVVRLPIPFPLATRPPPPLPSAGSRTPCRPASPSAGRPAAL